MSLSEQLYVLQVRRYQSLASWITIVRSPFATASVKRTAVAQDPPDKGSEKHHLHLAADTEIAMRFAFPSRWIAFTTCYT